MDSELSGNEFNENVPIPLNLGDYAWIIERACRASEDTATHGLKTIPKWVFTRTMYLIESVLKIGLFTRGRRREIIVLAALRAVLGEAIPFEDLIARAKLRFGLAVTQVQLQRALQDILILRRQYKNNRYRKIRLTNEDNRILVTIRNARLAHS